MKRVARKSGGLEWPSLPSRQEIAAATGAASEALKPSQPPDTALGAILIHIICPHERLNLPNAMDSTSISCPQHFIQTCWVPDHTTSKVKCQGVISENATSADPAHGPPELNKEVLATIEKLKKAAEKHPAPAASSDATKQIPSSLKPPLKAFALAVMRQAEKDKEALRLATQAIMPFMEPYVTRPNLMVCSLKIGAQSLEPCTLSNKSLKIEALLRHYADGVLGHVISC